MMEKEIIVEVFRKSQFQKINSQELVPGDILRISDDLVFPCDLIVLEGSCLVVESVITGESIPVSKHSLSRNKEKFDLKKHNSSILYSGTHCLKTKNNPVALVYRTGFLSFKGQILKEVVFQKVKRISFTEDSFKYIGLLAILPILGFLNILVTSIENGRKLLYILRSTCDIIIICVSPAIPAILETVINFNINEYNEYIID